MVRVEYRMLHVTISPFTGDRLTVALLHWDGTKLRIASSLLPLTHIHATQREHMRRAINAKLKRAKIAGRTLEERQGNLYGLAELVRVREGEGSSLSWSPVLSSATHSAHEHFEELRVLARLEQQGREEGEIVTNRALVNYMKVAAEQLSTEMPDRVLISNTIRKQQSLVSPISWKNGRWHHALPFSLDGVDESALEKRVRDMVGTVELCVPSADVPVPIAVLPKDPTLEQAALKGIHAIRECLSARGVEVVELRNQDGDVNLEPLIARIKADVAA